MRASAWIVGIVSALVVVSIGAGCGGRGKKPSQGVTTAPTTSASPAAAKAQIEQVWTTFFSGSTSEAMKIQLLQNGQRFAPLISAEAKSPLAKQTKATVSSVTLIGTAKAEVTYSIVLAGKPALTNQHGVAVRVGGAWKVGDSSFCQLLGLQGSKPPGCA